MFIISVTSKFQLTFKCYSVSMGDSVTRYSY